MMEIQVAPVVRRGNDVTEHLQRRLQRRQSVAQCCRRTVAFIFSHVGLATMVVAYSVAGGFLFRSLESPLEFQRRGEYGAMKAAKVGELKKLVDQFYEKRRVPSPLVRYGDGNRNFTGKVLSIFAKFQEEVTKAVRDGGWDGKDKNADSDLQWSFPGALLYAVSVITTIGYGHVTPKTKVGQIVTMCYALIGIPLTFLCLSNIGNILADGFRLFYCRVLCDICCCRRCERQHRLQRRSELRQQSQQQCLLGGDHRIKRPATAASGQGSNIGGDVRVQFLLASSCSDVAKDDNEDRSSITTTQNNHQRRPTDNFAFEPDDKMDLRSVLSGFDALSDGSSLLRSVSNSTSVSKSTRFRRFACLTPHNPTATNHNRHRNLKTSRSRPTSQRAQLVVPSLSSRTLLTPVDQPFDHVPVGGEQHSSSHGCCADDLGSRRRTEWTADNKAYLVQQHDSFRQLEDSDNEVRETDILSDDIDADDDDEEEDEVDCSSDDDVQRSDKSCSDVASPSFRSDSIRGSDDQLSVSVLERIADAPETEIVVNSSYDVDERCGENSRSSSMKNHDHHLTVNAENAASDNRKHQTDRSAANVDVITIAPDSVSAFSYQERITLKCEKVAVHSNDVISTNDLKRNKVFDEKRRSLRSSSELKLCDTKNVTEASSRAAKARIVWNSRLSNFNSQNSRDVTRSSASLAVGRRLSSSTPQPEVDNLFSTHRFSRSRFRRSDRPSSVACDDARELPFSAPTPGSVAARRFLSESASKFDDCRSGSPLGQTASSAAKFVRDPGGRFHTRRHNGSQKLTRQSHFTPSTSRPPLSLRLRCKRRSRLPISCPTSPNSTIEPDNVSLVSRQRYGVQRRRPLVNATSMAKSAGELNHCMSPPVSSKSDALVDNAASNESQDHAVDSKHLGGQDFDGGENQHTTNTTAADDTGYFICNVSQFDEIECKARNGSTGADKVTVPWYICLIIIVGYICCGAVLFTLWEEWDFLKASYFCFITLSTIGFGDIVPGTEENQWASHEKLVLCALWLAFGLSLLAMCFNLMQEEVRETFRLAGLKVGLIREELLDAAIVAD